MMSFRRKAGIALLLALCMTVTCISALADRKVSFPGSGLKITLKDGFAERTISQADIDDDMLCRFASDSITLDVWEWENDGSTASDLINELTDSSVTDKSIRTVNGLQLVRFSGRDSGGRFVGCIYAGNSVLYLVFGCTTDKDVKDAEAMIGTLR